MIHILIGILAPARLVQSSCASVHRNTREAGISSINNFIFYFTASIIQIAIMVSTLFSGLISDIFGRKKSLIIGQIFVFLGWILLYFAWNLYLLLTARCIMGVGKAISYFKISPLDGQKVTWIFFQPQVVP